MQFQSFSLLELVRFFWYSLNNYFRRYFIGVSNLLVFEPEVINHKSFFTRSSFKSNKKMSHSLAKKHQQHSNRFTFSKENASINAVFFTKITHLKLFLSWQKPHFCAFASQGLKWRGVLKLLVWVKISILNEITVMRSDLMINCTIAIKLSVGLK